MGKYAEIKTEFVRRELRQTSWQRRDFIDALMTVEQIAGKGGPPSMAEGMWLGDFRLRFPAAVHAIFSELTEGRS